MKSLRWLQRIVVILSTVWALVSCRTAGLSDDEVATLKSLEQVDDYPLYTMRYHGGYEERLASAQGAEDRTLANSADIPAAASAWACSLFAALGDADGMHYGRNFDWEYSPAVLLFTNPQDGYASVSVVDIAYLGFEGDEAKDLADLPLRRRQALLDAPRLPMDGMNEHGLVIAQAAVPPGHVQPDPDKETVGSLGVIRKVLDRARNVEEAIAVIESYNINFGGGPPLHYLIADPSGQSVLVEFYRGEMVVTPNETPWHLATNFLRAQADETGGWECWRYDTILRRLEDAAGRLTAQDAVDLLARVAQEGTQWSIVYGMTSGDVHVAMARQYDAVHRFHLDLADIPPYSSVSPVG